MPRCLGPTRASLVGPGLGVEWFCRHVDDGPHGEEEEDGASDGGWGWASDGGGRGHHRHGCRAPGDGCPSTRAVSDIQCTQARRHCRTHPPPSSPTHLRPSCLCFLPCTAILGDLSASDALSCGISPCGPRECHRVQLAWERAQRDRKTAGLGGGMRGGHGAAGPTTWTARRATAASGAPTAKRTDTYSGDEGRDADFFARSCFLDYGGTPRGAAMTCWTSRRAASAPRACIGLPPRARAAPTRPCPPTAICWWDEAIARAKHLGSTSA